MKISPIQSAGILEFYVENCYDIGNVVYALEY